MRSLSDEKANFIGNYLINTYYLLDILALIYAMLIVYEDNGEISFKDVLKGFQNCYDLSQK